ncbi:MAG: HAD family phosphatase [Clostridia bacterium]|nr:HAD family phosphatase [Clostridia bacterium]
MFKNIIFDFGNVLAEFYPEKLTSPCVSDIENVKFISEVVFDRLYWNKLDDGTITDEEVKEAFKNRVPEELYNTACTVYDSWVKNLTPVKGMSEIVKELKKKENAKLFLLSNISIGFAESYKIVPWIQELLAQFDGLVFSGPLGMVKPKKEIFEYLLNENNLIADECLFIDDSRINIDGAKKVGIHGYLFDGDAEKLRVFLGI